MFWQLFVKLYEQNLISAVVTALLFIIICSVLYGYLESKSLSRKKAVLTVECVILFLSLLLIVWATLIRDSGNRNIVLLPFASFLLARENPEIYREMLMNILLFIPFGVFLSAVVKGKRKKKTILTAVISLSLSILIETIQFLLFLGSTEIDDVICNSLGAVIGTGHIWLSTPLMKLVYLCKKYFHKIKSTDEN